MTNRADNKGGYMLFAGSYYYPLGGAKDLVGWFATQEDAIKSSEAQSFVFDWAHLLCLDTMNIVKSARFDWDGKLDGGNPWVDEAVINRSQDAKTSG